MGLIEYLVDWLNDSARRAPARNREWRRAHGWHDHVGLGRHQLFEFYCLESIVFVDEASLGNVVYDGWEEFHTTRCDELVHDTCIVGQHLLLGGQIGWVQHLVASLGVNVAQRLRFDAIETRRLVKLYKGVGDIPMPARMRMLVDDDEGSTLGRGQHRVDKRHARGTGSNAQVVAFEGALLRVLGSHIVEYDRCRGALVCGLWSYTTAAQHGFALRLSATNGSHSQMSS